MAALCIPKLQATKLINSLKNDGLARLQGMTSSERREFIGKIVGDEMAAKVNAKFEKALASNTKSALKSFAEKLVGVSGMKKKDVVARIEKLDEKGLLDGNVLEDYVSEFLGTKVTEKEVAAIRKLSEKTRVAEKNLSDEFAKVQEKQALTKEYSDALVDYAKALKETDEFLIANTPNDWSATLWDHALKPAMLFNPASWGVNIESNIINGITTAIERRVKNTRLTGYSSDLAKDWRKTMLRVRKESGYDLSRALSLDELLEKKVIGEKMRSGKDNFFSKFIYQGALGTPDAWAGRVAFSDALDLETASIVHGMGLKGEAAKQKARELFLDGIQVVPTSEEAKIARSNAVLEAQIATWTNHGVLANATLKMKQGLNKFAEDGLGLRGFKLGEMIEPFVKTIANISQYGLDSSAIGIIRGTGKFVQLGRNYKVLTEIQRKRLLGEALRDSMRTGFGVGGALALASFISEDNFMGAYDPNRHKYEQLRNSAYNAIRIGDKWYSLDWSAGFAAPLVAVLYAKKYGDGNTAKMLGQYAVGVVDQTSNIPFVGSLKNIGVELDQKVNPDDPNAAENTMKAVYDIFNNQITSRVPGLIINIAKLFDEKERETSGFLETLQSKLPGLRNGLPEKQDMFGQDILTERGLNPTGVDKYVAYLTQILAGARIKTAKSTSYGDEIRRLKDSGNPASFTSWKYRLGARQQRLKDKVGEEKYREIYREDYGKEVIKRIDSLIASDRYKKKSDKDKKKMIDEINDDVIERIYTKYKVPLR